jgi:hypothetical protein
LLRLRCSPALYHKTVSQWSASRIPKAPEDYAYLALLPKYIYARCPFCGTACTEKIDTYSLRGFHEMKFTLWRLLPRDYPSAYDVPCPHYMGVHQFSNLNGQMPTEVDIFGVDYGEVPYVTPWFLPKDIPSAVVLHALPICRTVKGEFVPTFTLFLLTYFSEHPQKVIDLHYEEERKEARETLNTILRQF